jgi:hypothetical protein
MASADNPFRVFKLYAAGYSSFTGLVVSGGYLNSGDSYNGDGAAFYIEASSPVSITNCEIRDNRAMDPSSSGYGRVSVHGGEKGWSVRGM